MHITNAHKFMWLLVSHVSLEAGLSPPNLAGLLCSMFVVGKNTNTLWFVVGRCYIFCWGVAFAHSLRKSFMLAEPAVLSLCRLEKHLMFAQYKHTLNFKSQSEPSRVVQAITGSLHQSYSWTNPTYPATGEMLPT